MAKFKVHFIAPNTDPRTKAMSAWQNPTYTIVEAFNIPAAQSLVQMQYPGARVTGCHPQ